MDTFNFEKQRLGHFQGLLVRLRLLLGPPAYKPALPDMVGRPLRIYGIAIPVTRSRYTTKVTGVPAAML